MTLIDWTYFINDINLPANVLKGDSSVIDSYIERYEEEALKLLLGYDLYKELKVEIDTVPQVFTAKWAALVNGAEYTVSGYLREWEGLVNDEKVSLLAYYVYYQYLKDNVNSYEAIGAVSSASENAVRVSADGLMVNAWNKFVELFNEAQFYLIQNYSTYPKLYTQPQSYQNTFGI